MTVPRQPRHRLADELDVPAQAGPGEPPTQVLPVIPAPRAAVAQGRPRPVPAGGPQRAHADVAAGSAVAPWPVAAQRPVRTRRRAFPAVLAGVTALVLVLGVGVVVVESRGHDDAAPTSAP